MAGAPDAPPTTVDLDPLALILNASGPVFVVVWSLIFAAVVVWFVAILKLLQLRRWAKAERLFEVDASAAEDAEHLFEIARHHEDAPGARVVIALRRRVSHGADLLESVAKRAVVDEEQRASTLTGILASIGSAAPFIGLFGTVWGIMDAFLRIGKEKTASLPVVAPAIGEALIATAIGLFAAIPAVIAYNAIAKRADDLLAAVESSAAGWVAMVTGGSSRSPAASMPVPTGAPR
ncbi:MAG: MotA/TolQ/ExbB proton channel family protein [Myxococcota bacterium]